MDCTAHRVGAVSGSIHLIADGCALLPSLMSSMTLGPHGWEATLSAFRVDESEQVDIACMVSVCSPGKCSHPVGCPPYELMVFPAVLPSGSPVGPLPRQPGGHPDRHASQCLRECLRLLGEGSSTADLCPALHLHIHFVHVDCLRLGRPDLSCGCY